MTTGPKGPAGASGDARIAYRCDSAWVDGAVRTNIEIDCAGGVITDVRPASGPGPAAPAGSVVRLAGLVLPGFADAHSHAFHRALRGRTHGRRGTFWRWREQMYALADRLDPDSLYELAAATYTELVCAGYTAVGEFHYLHHQGGGRTYDDPNAMGLALSAAATAAGIRLTLIDVAYLAGGFGRPVSVSQQRFSDRTAGAWADRVAALAAVLPPDTSLGVAIHSVRAVAARDLPVVAHAAAELSCVLHAHLSEQPKENEHALAATGVTPTQLLADAGALGPRTALVHATHLTDADIEIIGRHQCTAVICPATEADLADGLPAAARLAAAGAQLALGGDQHVVVDPFAQIRGLEFGARLAAGRRGVFSATALLAAAGRASHEAIGSPAGSITVGAPADLVAVRVDSARTAGCQPEQLVLAATAADVHTVVVSGAVRARDGVDVRRGDPGPALAAAVGRVWR